MCCSHLCHINLATSPNRNEYLAPHVLVAVGESQAQDAMRVQLDGAAPELALQLGIALQLPAPPLAACRDDRRVMAHLHHAHTHSDALYDALCSWLRPVALHLGVALNLPTLCIGAPCKNLPEPVLNPRRVTCQARSSGL